MKKIVFISILVLILIGIVTLLSASVDYDQLKADGKLPITEQTTYAGSYPDITKNVVGQQRGLLIPRDASFDVVPFAYGLGVTGPPDYRNDDGYTDPISLPFNFCFYGDLFNEFYINNNGNISFNGGYSTYSSSGFPINDFPMLAPFWGDVDTRPVDSGLVYYRIEPHRVTVIWENVGYFGNHVDLLNTFELIFTDGTDPLIGVGNNVAFSYGDMQWTTGDASSGSGGFGGTPATVGINRGDGVDFALIGRFDHPGIDYDGPGGNSDGVDYLDNLLFNFAVCTLTSNVAPVGSGFPAALPVIIVGETYNLTVQFLSPEVGQITSTLVDATGLSDFTHTSTPGNPSVIDLQIIGTLNNLGFHNIQFTATDDGSPPMSTIVNLVIEIIEDPVNETTVKWVQNPDPIGWDVFATSPMILADDFECTELGLIKDIHFWGSWFADDVGEITSFEFNIYGDIPVGDQGNNYSMPDDISQWNYVADIGTFTIVEQPESTQGWHGPPDYYEYQNHLRWFKYNVILPPDNWFLQQGTINAPIIYWLSITANVAGSINNWGWKSSVDHWNDDAVFNTAGITWIDLHYPDGISMDLAFVLTGDSDPFLPVELSSFSGAFNSDLCSSMLSWTTQSESENMGWNVYRSTSPSFNESVQLNASIITGAGTTSEPTNYQYQDLSDIQFNTEYRYWLECLSFDGDSQQIGPIVVNTLSEEEQPDTPELVTAIGLKQNYPNPFNPDTQISFIMEKTGECDLTIYDTKGRIVKDLFKGNIEAEQNYTFTWNGRNNNGKSVASGIYLYKIKSGNYIETKKMILMK